MRCKIAAICLAAVLASTPAWTYAIFAHQQLIDLTWDQSIRPLLLQRYPGLTASELKVARSYAYGGSIVQDMGYYPIGHRFFSDLTHYVRSGDFVVALFRNARNANELAFAVGALSHYVGDSIGHSEAVNPSTGETFPHLVREYGPSITYEEAPIDHNRVEFGFDVAQIAQRNYAPENFRRQVGFRIAETPLNRALLETYDLDLDETLGHVRPSSTSYRFCVHKLLPLFAQAQVVRLKGKIDQRRNDQAFREFRQTVYQAAQTQQWAAYYRPPGKKAHLLAFLFHFIPRIGALRIIDIKAPTDQTEGQFVRSMNQARDVLASQIGRYASSPQSFHLANLDLDTGSPVAPGSYRLTDETYARLVTELATNTVNPPPVDLVNDILAYYSDPNAPIVTKKDREDWNRVLVALSVLTTRYRTSSN